MTDGRKVRIFCRARCVKYLNFSLSVTSISKFSSIVLITVLAETNLFYTKPAQAQQTSCHPAWQSTFDTLFPKQIGWCRKAKVFCRFSENIGEIWPFATRRYGVDIVGRLPGACVPETDLKFPNCRGTLEHADQLVAIGLSKYVSECGECPPEGWEAALSDQHIPEALEGCVSVDCDAHLASLRQRTRGCASQICSGEDPAPNRANFCDGLEDLISDAVSRDRYSECRNAADTIASDLDRLENINWDDMRVDGALGAGWMSPNRLGPDPTRNSMPGIQAARPSAQLGVAQALLRELSRQGILRRVRNKIRQDQACRYAENGRFSVPNSNGSIYRSAIEVVTRDGARTAIEHSTTYVGRSRSFNDGVAGDRRRRSEADQTTGTVSQGAVYGGEIVDVYTWVPD